MTFNGKFQNLNSWVFYSLYVIYLVWLTNARLSLYYNILKASAHSFKQFTSRLLKSTFSLSMHIYNSDERHA